MDRINGASTAWRVALSRRLMWGAAAWLVGWGAMVALDGHVDLGNLSMVLVLASAVASVWLPIGVSIAVSMVAVLAFNWRFVTPRGTFAVNVGQDAILLLALLVVTALVAGLMAAQRAAADRARWHARHADQLRRMSDALRDVADPTACAAVLRAALESAVGHARIVLLMRDEGSSDANEHWLGAPTSEQRMALQICARDGTALGAGGGRHADLPDWYLPLRGRERAFGAALVVLDAYAGSAVREQAQALCDQVGLTLERQAAARAAAAAQQHAQVQAVRNTLLAAISHDYRTPLATIMGAASSLVEQGDRLQPAQRQRLAETIVAETMQLGRLTDNTLQLARLDSAHVELRMGPESAEEIVGACLRRARRRDVGRRLRARLEPELPLVRCDALLLAQLLDNLIDNALKYSEPPAPVELLVRRQDGHVVFAVRDRGPGIPGAERDRVFDAFRRGTSTDRACRGVGIGLTVCRAIARAHGGDLRLRTRSHGGSSFECWLPDVATRVDADVAAGTLS